jgi:hypothetical protein
MPSRAHGGPAPRPGKPALKPSQVHALTAIVDRELPNALKRLSEAEDRCLSAATNLLDQASSLDGFGEVLGLLSGLESVAADERATRHLSSLADIARKVSETINHEASFGDLIGQRIVKISEFLETVHVILQEILEEHSAPKKAPAPRAAPSKWAQREQDPGPARTRGKGTWAAREPEDGPLPEDDRDGGHTGDRPRAAKRARPDGPVKRPRDKADPPRGDDSFGPDDEGLDQEEVNDLIKKLGPRS